MKNNQSHFDRDRQFTNQNNRQKRSPRRSPNSRQGQQLKQPLLQRNRTESDVSYEGNTIDMVRIVRKNEENRLSLMNIDRKQYMKYNHEEGQQGPNSHTNRAYDKGRYSERQHHQSYMDQEERQAEIRRSNVSSTFVHLGTTQRPFYLAQNTAAPNIIEHYIRPSNVNILNSINQESSNKLIGVTLFALFMVLFSLQILAGAYFLNACHVIVEHLDYVMVFSYDSYYDSYYDYLFDQWERDNFLLIMILYLGIQCLYHLIVFLIDKYTKGIYRLIDPETSKLKYILKCRDFNRNSHTQTQKILKSPKFTIFLIILSTVLSSIGLIHCFYYNQLNEIYVYYMSSTIIKLIQIFYFAVILPEVWRFLFFQKMHVVRQSNQERDDSRKELNDSLSDKDQWKIPPLTDFNIDDWWMKLALVVLLLSFVYSVIWSSVWLIVVGFSRMELSFKRLKYRMDTFYLQAGAKFLLLCTCVTLLLFRQPSPFTLLTVQYSLQCTILLTSSFLLARLLANIFIRRELYKYLYDERHINIAFVLFVFVVVYLVDSWTGEVQFWGWKLGAVGCMSLGLVLSVYVEGKHREVIRLDGNDRGNSCRDSDQGVEMGNF